MDELMQDTTQNLVTLSDAALSQLPEGVLRPKYNRSQLTPGIVHIGLGNFHRAHQAWYLHRLFQDGQDLDWAIIGAGVRQWDAEMRAKMKAQDCLTTLIELDPKGRSAEVCGSMIDYIDIRDGNGPLIAQMSDPAIRIVALTVTESGYFLDPATKEFAADHPDIQHDAANPTTPRTAFGAMVEALKRRRDAGHGAFTCLSCDNLQGNGTLLKQTVTKLAELSDPDLAKWIADNSTFPNSMVDCIVPATGPKELELVKTFGIDDKVPVTHENFRQWVIEDDFCAGRPNWDKAGATFSDSVHDFEAMKLRILNGGHQVIANPGDLLGIESISGSMADPAINALFRKVQSEEIVPHVAAVPGFTAPEYLDLVIGRFSNPEIVDTTRRVAFDGSSRHPGFLLPTVRDGLAAGASVEGLALVEALFCRYCYGTREDGSAIEPNDPQWDALHGVAKEARDNPAAWLAMTPIYGDLGQKPAFADAFDRWLRKLHSDGIRATLEAYAG